MSTTSCKGISKAQNRKNVAFGKVFCTLHNTDLQYKENSFRNVAGKEEKARKQDLFY